MAAKAVMTVLMIEADKLCNFHIDHDVLGQVQHVRPSERADAGSGSADWSWSSQ